MRCKLTKDLGLKKKPKVLVLCPGLYGATVSSTSISCIDDSILADAFAWWSNSVWFRICKTYHPMAFVNWIKHKED